MRIEDQILQLEHEKAAAIAQLKHHSVRATRNIKRALSPDRAIRKHIGAAMLAAAVAGMMAAPAPKYVKRSEIREEIRKSRKGSGLMGMIGKLVPGLDRLIPQQPQQEQSASEPESHHEHGHMGLLLGQAMSMLVSRIDVQALLAQILGQNRPAPGVAPSRDGHPEEPHVSVGDAGTGRPPE